MRTSRFIICLALISLTVPAQVPIKTDLMQMLGKIPQPPTSVKESYTKIAARDEVTLSCSADKIFTPIEQELKKFETEFEAGAKASLGMAAPDASSEQAKRMSDPAMKKKMKSMTKEERMAMAMEMMKSAPAGTPPMDPPLVRAALDEWQKIYNDTQNEFNRSVAAQKEEGDLREQYVKAHSEIDAWESAEIAKLPQISSGEMSAPDPVKVKKVQILASDRHIALADKHLEQIRSRWQASIDRSKERYTPFYGKLVKADYASESKNFSTKKILSDAQLMVLKEVHHHVQLSRNAWEESASWQARRIMIEQEK